MSKKHHRAVLENQAREIIGRVYDFMKKEAVSNHVEKLADARWRTAQAAGVSESTVTRILRERRAHAQPHGTGDSTEHTIEHIKVEPFVEIQEEESTTQRGTQAALHSNHQDTSTPPAKRKKLEKTCSDTEDDE